MRRIGIVFAVAILILGFTPTVTRAQNASEGSKSKVGEPEKGAADQAKSVQAFRLDFSLNELTDGKKVNTRHYSLDLTSGSKNQLKIGTRVPVATGVTNGSNPLVSNTQWQYVDVGTRIWASLFPRAGGDLELQVDSEISNLDIPQSQNQNPSNFADAHPVVRQLQIGGTTLLETGKPILIGTMDDPNSNREFQLEVTATKLR